MLHYVRNLENRSTCTQVLGKLIRTSWRNRVVPLNRPEVEVLLGAFANLTDTEVMIDKITFPHVHVFLPAKC